MKTALFQLLAGTLCMTTVMAGTMPRAHALELFGWCLWGSCEDPQSQDSIDFIDPLRYDAQLTTAPGTEDNVDDAVKSASQLWGGRNDAVGGSAGLVARAKGDYRRILASLYNQGHYGGAISIRLNGQEAAALAVGTELNEPVNVTIDVEPGPLYRFGRADVENAAPPTDDPNDQVPSLTDVGFVAGAPAQAGAVRRAATVSRDAWRQQGYALAKVEDRTATADHPANELNVRLLMHPGPLASIGPLSVEGTARMDPDFVAYYTGLTPGAEYDPDDIARARKRLERLGVFSVQKFEEADALNADGGLPLLITVDERKLRRIGAGVTVSSIDGFGAEAFWLHRNLFGRAERLRLEASVGGVGSLDVEDYDYALGATFTKPGVFNPDTDFVARSSAQREVTEAYTETSGGGSLALTHYLTDQITVSGGVFGEYARFERPSGDREFVTAGTFGTVLFDARDDELDPTSGFLINAEVKPFYEFEFANAGVRIEAEGRGYLALDDDGRNVLAGRVKFGSVYGPARAQTADNFLFFAGGGGSVRGYAFEEIGIREANGDLTGGASLLEASAEARIRFTEQLGGVAFVDAGVVSRDSTPSFDEDVRVGVGIGVRYYTALGPLRLDVALPLNKEPGGSDFGVYAGIGQAF